MDPRPIKFNKKQHRAIASSGRPFQVVHDTAADAIGGLCALEEWFDSEFLIRHEALWTDCSVVVGMHPGVLLIARALG